MQALRLRAAPTGRLVLLVCATWALLGLFLGVQVYLNAQARGRSTSLAFALGDSLRRYSIYALLTFPVLWLCRKYALDSTRWRRSLFAHTVGCAAFSLLYAAIRIQTAVNPETMERVPATLETLLTLVRANIFELFWMYASIVFVVLTLQYHQQSREREIREANMQRRMAEYELQILKLQLHPHFLFNTLNGISALMARDVSTAREMLVRLSDLLRIALAHTRDKEVPLHEELAFLKAYLELERMRLGDRLMVDLRIDPVTLHARVPNMLLQPLVENAIRHGVEAMRAGGRVEMVAARVNGSLRIVIANDGPPLRSTERRETGHGTGLRNTLARLQNLHGDACQISLADRTQGGVELRLQMPFIEGVTAEGAPG